MNQDTQKQPTGHHVCLIRDSTRLPRTWAELKLSDRGEDAATPGPGRALAVGGKGSWGDSGKSPWV